MVLDALYDHPERACVFAAGVVVMPWLKKVV
jgi:hypothetical protein